jgi:outer membrane protein assembly factor BamB
MPSTTRRRFLAACGVGALSTATGCSGADGSRNAASATDAAGDRTDWPTAGHDRANTNAIPGAPSIRGVTRMHRFDSGLNAAQPIVADGTLYHVTDALRAIDVESGEERWALSPEEGQGNFWAAPTVDGDTVYLANGHQRVHAVDAASGEKRWTTELDVGTRCSPTLDHDGEALFVGGEGHVSRLDTETGEVAWTHELFGQVQETLAVDRQVVYAVTEGGELYALDEYGDGYWRVDLPAKCGMPPTVVQDSVYVGTFDGFVHAVDTSRANLAWSTEVGGFAKGGIAVAEDTVYADGGRELHAMYRDTGGHRWSFDVGTTGDHTPVVAGETVYTTGDRLYALKPGGGVSNGTIRQDAVRFTHETGGYAGPMSVADGRLFVTARLGDEEGDVTTALLVLEPS